VCVDASHEAISRGRRPAGAATSGSCPRRCCDAIADQCAAASSMVSRIARRYSRTAPRPVNGRLTH
jgi:hypothetical protein